MSAPTVYRAPNWTDYVPEPYHFWVEAFATGWVVCSRRGDRGDVHRGREILPTREAAVALMEGREDVCLHCGLTVAYGCECPAPWPHRRGEPVRMRVLPLPCGHVDDSDCTCSQVVSLSWASDVVLGLRPVGP